MIYRITKMASAVVVLLALILPATIRAEDGGVVRVKSAYSFDETISRLRKDIAGKGIMMFTTIDQARLAADAGITLRRSSLMIFGNPALGTQFIAAKPQAGLDWPVRLLVQEDEKGRVWLAYTDFAWIAKRHGIRDSDQKPFATASGVIASITSSVQAE